MSLSWQSRGRNCQRAKKEELRASSSLRRQRRRRRRRRRQRWHNFTVSASNSFGSVRFSPRRLVFLPWPKNRNKQKKKFLTNCVPGNCCDRLPLSRGDDDDVIRSWNVKTATKKNWAMARLFCGCLSHWWTHIFVVQLTIVKLSTVTLGLPQAADPERLEIFRAFVFRCCKECSSQKLSLSFCQIWSAANSASCEKKNRQGHPNFLQLADVS